MKKGVFVVISIVIILVFALFLIRMFSERQLDDVSPEIPCETELMKKTDVFFIIPKFNNKNIAEKKEWCEKIKQLDKELALHGVYHTYNEFLEDRNEQYLENGISAFEECFQKSPERFKPPQLEISKNNKMLVKSKLELELYFNEIFHKVYHCDDTGIFSNKFIDWV